MLDRIRNLCLRKKISIAKLERDLGFANGSIAKSDEKIQANRLNAIAEYFGVTMEYLLYGRTRDSSIMPLLEMMVDMGYEICDFADGRIYLKIPINPYNSRRCCVSKIVTRCVTR